MMCEMNIQFYIICRTYEGNTDLYKKNKEILYFFKKQNYVYKKSQYRRRLKNK